MLTLKERTEVYRLGLNCGLFSKDEVIHWIDEQIMQSPNPDYTLIEASLLNQSKSIDLSYKLKELEGRQREGYAMDVLFGLCYMELLKEPFF